MAPRGNPKPAAHENALNASEQFVSRMWSDTINLLKSIFDELPSGPFGAIIRLSGAAMVLLALLAILSMITTKRTDIVVQLVIFMFLFFMASVLVYVFRPPDDVVLAKGQSRRLRQIAPKPMTLQSEDPR
jgi:asparagine N-glycosylation enzyme membrane subunit Stt3